MLLSNVHAMVSLTHQMVTMAESLLMPLTSSLLSTALLAAAAAARLPGTPWLLPLILAGSGWDAVSVLAHEAADPQLALLVARLLDAAPSGSSGAAASATGGPLQQRLVDEDLILLAEADADPAAAALAAWVGARDGRGAVGVLLGCLTDMCYLTTGCGTARDVFSNPGGGEQQQQQQPGDAAAAAAIQPSVVPAAKAAAAAAAPAASRRAVPTADDPPVAVDSWLAGAGWAAGSRQLHSCPAQAGTAGSQVLRSGRAACGSSGSSGSSRCHWGPLPAAAREAWPAADTALACQVGCCCLGAAAAAAAAAVPPGQRRLVSYSSRQYRQHKKQYGSVQLCSRWADDGHGTLAVCRVRSAATAAAAGPVS